MFERANLSHNNLSTLNLSGAMLNNAKVSDSDLVAADPQSASLSSADTENANLSEVNLSGADLRSANLANVRVGRIQYDRKARFRGIRVASCYGSARFRRFAQDQDYIDHKEAHGFFYCCWWLLTDCGRSMLRVIFWCICIAVIFGLIFYGLGAEVFAVANSETPGWTPFTTVYYGVVTFTTLGFGDITPRTSLAAGLVMLEVITGYLMPGILISILASKVARRS